MLKRYSAVAVLGLGLVIAPAVAQAQGRSGGGGAAAGYSPSTKNLAGTLPFSETYTLQVTSPSSLNNAGDEQISGAGVLTTMKVTALSFPNGSSQAGAEALVTLSTPSLLFTALNQGQSIDVTFTATGSTLPGDYSYSIQADPPAGLGWGVGSHTLNVEVAEPTLVDTTPPNVSITSPTAGSSYVFCSTGVTVPIRVEAQDADSPVTGMSAFVGGTPVLLSFTSGQNVEATGNYTATGVGSFNVNASATSQGGTGNASEVNFTVRYDATWLPPLALGKTSKGGSTIPIKITARDCVGAFVHDESVSIVVYEGAAKKFEAGFGDGASAVRIDDVDAHYITNFQTEAGQHTYTVKVFFGGLLHESLNFSVR